MRAKNPGTKTAMYILSLSFHFKENEKKKKFDFISYMCKLDHSHRCLHFDAKGKEFSK